MRAVAAVFVALAATACGSESVGARAPTLDEWRASVCAVVAEHEEELSATDADFAPDELFELMREESDAIRAVAGELRELALPSERRGDAERFVAAFGEVADLTEEMVPRMEAAMERWEEVLKSIDPESLPPAPEDATAIAGTMAQLMSVPEAREAYEEMARQGEEMMSRFDGGEMERLATSLRLEECIGDGGAG